MIKESLYIKKNGGRWDLASGCSTCRRQMDKRHGGVNRTAEVMGPKLVSGEEIKNINVFQKGRVGQRFFHKGADWTVCLRSLLITRSLVISL